MVLAEQRRKCPVWLRAVKAEPERPGMVMPDHIPQHDDPANRDQGFAFVYGYTKALLQSMYGFDAYPDHALDLTAADYALQTISATDLHFSDYFHILS